MRLGPDRIAMGVAVCPLLTAPHVITTDTGPKYLVQVLVLLYLLYLLDRL